MSFTRRSLFGRGAGLAAAGAIAPLALGEGVQGANLAKLTFAAKDYGGYASGQTASTLTMRPPTIFTSFGEWWAKAGEKRARERAQYVSSLDPDIQGFRLPLQTKVHLQQARNLERLKREDRREFQRALRSSGAFSWFLPEDEDA